MKISWMPLACAMVVAGWLMGVGSACGKESDTSRAVMDSAMAFRVEVVATDLRVPWSIVFAPGGRIFFTERPGRVRVMEKGKLREQPLLTLPDVDTTLKLGMDFP